MPVLSFSVLSRLSFRDWELDVYELLFWSIFTFWAVTVLGPKRETFDVLDLGG